MSERGWTVKPQDVGLGAFYYFASVPIIGVMNYAGYGRSTPDMILFCAVLVSCISLIHLAMALSSRFRKFATEVVEPSAAVLAALVILLACLSALGPLGRLPLLLSAALCGLVCAVVVGSWLESPSIALLRPSAFSLSASLGWAVLFYVVYRFLQFFSGFVAAGWQTAVPMVGIVALLIAYSPDYRTIEGDPIRRRAFYLLGLVAAVFAVSAGIFGYISDYPGARDHSEFTPMVLVEMLGVVVIASICRFMERAAQKKAGQANAPRGRGFKVVSSVLLVVPSFSLGCVSGTLPTGSNPGNFLWEASIWVLLIAVFVCGMRTSLFAMRGLAVGIMWETWCMGQATSHLLVLVGGAGAYFLLLCFPAVVYFAALVAHMGRPDTSDVAADVRAVRETVSGRLPVALDNDDPQVSFDSESNGSVADISVSATCVRLAQRYGLSSRELEVLSLVGDGRSAKYISESLVISFNTARSHIRHIYEKLDVHSKQELIDLIKDETC